MPSPLRRLLVGVAASLAVAMTVPGASAPALGKAVDQTYPVPASRVLTVVGHGWGHGHGMSQYGARGAARQGLSYQRILGFYYPGTALTTATGRIRVLVTSDTTDDVVVSPVAGLRVRDRATGAAYPLPSRTGVRRWRLDVVRGHTVVSYRTDAWHRWKRLQGNGAFFSPGRTLTLWTPAGARTYRGILRSAPPAPGSAARDTVNVLSLDAYVKGVVPYEMPVSWERAAVRAQAVAARTYAAWSRASRPSSYFHICDTTACQVYGGVAAEDARSNAAVDATAGRVLGYEGAPAFTQFSSSSGGWTSRGSAPYLVSKADPYEADSDNPYADWSVPLKAAAVQRAYPVLGRLRAVRVTSREGGGEWDGRVWSLTLDGSEADVVVTGDAFRSRFGLRSTYFSFDG